MTSTAGPTVEEIPTTSTGELLNLTNPHPPNGVFLPNITPIHQSGPYNGAFFPTQHNDGANLQHNDGANLHPTYHNPAGALLHPSRTNFTSYNS
jgi:hypothetical protein